MKTEQEQSASNLQIANHILPTSSNLLGICFIILSFIKINGLAPTTYLDESLVAPILCFFGASILSYMSIRSKKRRGRSEMLADWFFMAGLFSLTVIAFIFIFEVL